jgi:hypothetical protein
MGWLVKSGCLGWGYSGRLRLRVLRGRRVWEPVPVSVPVQRQPQRQRQVQKRIQGALRFGREDGELGGVDEWVGGVGVKLWVYVD